MFNFYGGGRITLNQGAIEQALRFTREAREYLNNNSSYHRSNTASHLAEWNDKNVARYMDLLADYDDIVKRCIGQLDEIERNLQADLRIFSIY